MLQFPGGTSNPEGIFQFCQTKDSGIWKKIEPKKQIVQKHTRRIDMVTVWDDTFYYVFLPLPIKWGNNSTTAETSDGRKAEIKTKIENGVLKAVCTIYENAADTEDSEKPPKDETIKSKVYDKIELPFKKDEPWATSLTRQRLSRWKITTDSTD